MFVSMIDKVQKMKNPKILVVTNDGKRRIYDIPQETCENPNLVMVIDNKSVLMIPIRTIQCVEIYDKGAE